MQQIKVELMSDHSEVIPYEKKGIPLHIFTSSLSFYPGLSAPCHWHDDLEWIHILKGTMCYSINGKQLLLKEQDSLMVNSRHLHYGYAFKKQDCTFSCILFHPSLLCSNPILFQKYIAPVLENTNLTYLYFEATQMQENSIAETLEKITTLKEQAEEAYELEVIALMQSLFCQLLRQKYLFPKDSTPVVWDDLEIQKNMVSFLYQHYADKLSLEDIAASAHVSRSKCCMIFKRYLQQSPIEFLNAYRLKVSCNLLTNTDKSITEIAFSCGFHHLSYFSKMFMECYGCTPREYRRKHTC